MRIPTGNFGNAVPNPQPTRVNVSGTGAIGQAVAEVADDAKREVNAVVRARAGNSMYDYQIGIKDSLESIRQRVEDGTLRADQVENVYHEAVAKLDKPQFAGLGIAETQVAEGGLKRYESDGLTTAQGYARAALKIEARDQVDSGLDKLGKLTNYPGADIEKINAMSAAYEQQGRLAYGSQWSKVRQNFVDKNWFNQAQQKLMEARNNGGALSDFSNQLTSEKGFYIDKLDPDKRNALLNQAMGYQTRLEAKAAAAEAKREALALRAVNSVAPLIYAGKTVSAELQDKVITATRGTSSEGEVKELLSLGPQIQEVISKGPLESTNYVSQLSAELNKKGGTIADYRRLDMLDRAVQANNKVFADDPVSFAQNRIGEEVQPLDLSGNAELLSSQLADRADTLTALQQNVGIAVPKKLLRPQEAQQLTTLMETAPASQKAAILDAIRRGAGGDTKTYTTTLQQISQGAPSAAAAGMIMDKSGRVADDISPSTAATAILEGADARREKNGLKGIPMPKDTDLRPEFASQLKGVTAGNSFAAEKIYQTAQDYYAGVKSRKGDISGSYDKTLWLEAINVATGGIYDYNGQGKVLLPWGMSEDQFNNEVNRAWKAQVIDTGISTPPGQYGLQSYGDSQYLVKLGAGYLYDTKGAPVVLDLTRPKVRFAGDIPQ
ncbi:hypothetical protein [Pectobacterium brasiliense]|uniref:hypothetical protein n=1 Tax=Pectobacterium brasiliense TaxID=180957 RepID=UPI003873A55C